MLELRRKKSPQRILTDFTPTSSASNTTGGFMNSSRVGSVGSPKYKSNSTDFNAESTSLYVLPPNVCDAAVAVDFVCVCINPPIEVSLFDDDSHKGSTATGYRFLENQLELHLMPTNMVDNTVNILTKFEQQVLYLPTTIAYLRCLSLIKLV